MTDYCSAYKFIGNFASGSSGGTSTTYIKNLDAVSVEADLVSCGKLTINNVEIDDTVSSLTTKTQYQTASADNTSFTGTVTSTGVRAATVSANSMIPYTGTSINFGTNTVYMNTSAKYVGINTVAPAYSLDVNGEGNFSTALRVTSSATSSVTLLQLLGPSVSTATTTNEIRMFIGTTNSTRTGGVIAWCPRAAVTDNRLSLYVTGTSAPRLDINASTSPNVSITGSLCTTPLVVQVTSGSSATISNIPSAATVITLSLVEIGQTGNGSVFLRVGSTSISTTNIYSYAFNQKNSTNEYSEGNSSTSFISLCKPLNNSEKLYGNITLTKLKYGTAITYAVSGVLRLSGGTDETQIVMVSGWINTQYEITQVQLSPGSTYTFNVSTGLMQVTTL